MTAERMFKEYKNLKKEQGILLFQLEQFIGIEESDVINSMMFGHADGNDRVQTSNRSDKTASVAINYKSVMDRENDEWFEFLWNRYQAVVEELKFFEHSVASLDGILPELVMDLVRGELTWETMEQKYNVSHAMIGKYRKAAMKELDFCTSFVINRRKPLFWDKEDIKKCADEAKSIMWILEIMKIRINSVVSVQL